MGGFLISPPPKFLLLNLLIQMTTINKSKFETMGFTDGFASDDEKPAAKKATNKKLEAANKQSHKTDAAPRYQKMNANQAKQDGFEIAGEVAKETRGAGDRGRGGRGGRGGDRPRTVREPRLDADGNPIPFKPREPRLDADGNPIPFKPREPRGDRPNRGNRDPKHEGKDREDGTGKARRERKAGGERNYKKKGEDGEVVEG